VIKRFWKNKIGFKGKFKNKKHKNNNNVILNNKRLVLQSNVSLERQQFIVVENVRIFFCFFFLNQD
jgi:hypothetical protein